MNIVAVIVARMTSKRLPGKPLLNLGGKSNFERHVERVRLVPSINGIYLATARSSDNDVLVEKAEHIGIKIYRGEEEDIVGRFEGVAKASQADLLVRINCDKPLFCFDILKEAIANYNGEDYDFLPNDVLKGVGHELISARAIREIHKHYSGTAVAQLMRQRPHEFKFKIQKVDNIYRRPEYRLDLDTVEDYELLSIVFEKHNRDDIITSRDAIAFLDDNPQVALINQHVQDKNVNSYSDLLEDKNIFSIVSNQNGKYIVVDRTGRHIPYSEFLRYVNEKERWVLQA